MMSNFWFRQSYNYRLNNQVLRHWEASNRDVSGIVSLEVNDLEPISKKGLSHVKSYSHRANDCAASDIVSTNQRKPHHDMRNKKQAATKPKDMGVGARVPASRWSFLNKSIRTKCMWPTWSNTGPRCAKYWRRLAKAGTAADVQPVSEGGAPFKIGHDYLLPLMALKEW